METTIEYKAASDTVPFKERVNRLVRELERAIRFDRPSILLAIYQSELVRAEAEKAIVRQLHEMGQRTERVTINEEKYDLPLYLVQQPDHEKTVYFVQGLQWGGGEDGRNAYRALNIRREYFVDYRLRFILWLTEKEAYYLPRYAPDFWAFRHRVVEFFDFPDEDQIKKHGLDLIFRDMDDESMFDQDIDAKIGYRKRLLAQLSEKPETIVDRAGLLVILGVLYTVKDEYEMALRSYAEAMELTKQLEAIELESVKLTRLSDSNNHFQSLIYSFQGFVYAGLGQYEKALDDLNRAIQLDPNRAPAYNRRGNIYQKLGQYEQALADYKRAIQLNPEDITSYNNRGNIYANLGQYEKALADYERVVHLNPDDAITYNNRGTTYHDMGQYEQAIADFNEAIRLNPDYASAYNNRGNAYAILGQYEQAIVNYQQANELDSNWVVPIKRLGDVYAEIGDYAAAVSKYKQAIQVDPLFDNVYYDLALIYRTQAKYNEAIEACLKVIENDPEHVHALNGLGYLYIQMDDLKEAERYLDMSIKLSENSLNLLNMGIVKWRMKKTQAANKYFLRALELNSDSDLSEEETLVVRGWLQVVTGQLEEGLANISRSFSQYPNPPHRASNVRDWTKALLLANDSPPGLERALQLAEKYLDSLH